MPADVLSMLERDHRHVEQALDALAHAQDDGERERLVREVSKALSAHMQFEEEHVYPLLQQIDAELSEEGEVEHQLAREGLAKMTDFLSEPGFGAVVDMLAAGINHHVEEEESEVFPQLRKQVNAELLASLGRTLLEHKRVTGTLVPPDATKEELLELARDQGVEGRSEMSKDELRVALEAR
jgi:hemerythrin superfamily protein